MIKDCPRNRPREQQEDASSAVTFVAGEICTNWIVDSGATHHMSLQKEWLSELKPHTASVKCASKREVQEDHRKGKIIGENSKGLNIIL